MRKAHQRRSTLDNDISRKAAFAAWDSALEQLGGAIEAYMGKADQIHNHFPFLPLDDAAEAGSPAVEQGRERASLSIEQGLLHLDSKLDLLATLEEKLRATRVKLQGLRNTSTTLSPINRLPPEILSLIIILGDERDEANQRMRKEVQEDQGWDDDDEMDFEEGEKDSIIFDDEENENTNDDGRNPHFPTNISHVCKAWRQIAINTAKLWTHIDFREGHPFEKTAQWIKRSKQCELVVEVEMPDDDTGRDDMWNLLEQCAPRTASLALSTWTIDELLTAIEHFTSGEQSPPLKSLKLCVEDADGEPVVPKGVEAKPQLFLGLMRGLEHVDFNGVHLSWGSETYRGLKSLRLSNFSALDEVDRLPRDEEVYTMLVGCPQLERLMLDTVWLRPDEDDDGLPRTKTFKAVQLIHLKTLHLTRLPITMAHFLLTTISAVNLEHFVFAEYGIDQTAASREVSEFSKIFPAFLDRIEPKSLKYLRVTEMPEHFSNANLTQCLMSAPRLEELAIDNAGSFDDEVMKLFLPPTNAVPNLETLRISNCSEFTAASLKDVVSHRNLGSSMEVKPIKRLVVKYCTLEDADDDLQSFMSENVRRLVWIVDEEEDVEDEDEGEDIVEVDVDDD